MRKVTFQKKSSLVSLRHVLLLSEKFLTFEGLRLVEPLRWLNTSAAGHNVLRVGAISSVLRGELIPFNLRLGVIQAAKPVPEYMIHDSLSCTSL